MKVEVFTKHWGLADVLRNILEKSHEVVITPESQNFPLEYNFKRGYGDIHISCFPYEDLKDFKKDKPLILYATDPVYEWVFQDFKDIQKWGGCVSVVAEPCFYPEYFPITGEYEIPFAIDTEKYTTWRGGINKVGIINRKWEDRWREVVTGATGIPYTLEQFLGDIPFDIVSKENSSTESYRQKLSEYDVLFYYSNSPYTIVMFEEMAIGAPIVAFNKTSSSTYSPIEKYIDNWSIEMGDVRWRLKEALNHPEAKKYPIMPFDTVVKKWNTVINTAYDNFKRL